MNTNWKTKNTCVYNINYHIVWIPKYRKKILKGNIRERLIEILFQKADEIKVIIKCREIMSDHVHLFITATPSHNITNISNNISFIFQEESLRNTSERSNDILRRTLTLCLSFKIAYLRYYH
jgi:REP element-mobilizing transposase RayT